MSVRTDISHKFMIVALFWIFDSELWEKESSNFSSAGSENEPVLCHKQIAPPGKQTPDSGDRQCTFTACRSSLEHQ